MHPVQQAFRECHGLQCGFCTPGFLTTIAAFLEDNPEPTEEEAREAISRQPVPLHRLPEHRQGRRVLRRRPRSGPTAHERAGGRVTTKLFGEPVQRVEDAQLVTGGGRFLDDLGHDALAAAFVRSPHAHARITDIDVTGALDVDGLVAIYTYEDLTGRAGRAASRC